MNISKKKKMEFDNIFKSIDNENFFIDINLYRKLFESDFHEHFLSYVDLKIAEILEIKNSHTIILHTDINTLIMQDTLSYEKIIQFAKVLHKYTLNISKIIIHGKSILFTNFIKLINMALGTNVNEKILFTNEKFKFQ